MRQDRDNLELSESQTVAQLRPIVWFFGALMIVIGIVTLVLMLRDFESDSYLYLAFYAIPSNTAISVFPHEPVLIYFGKVANLWWAAGAATAGTLVAGVMDHLVFVPILKLQSIQAYREKKFYQSSPALR